MTDLHVDRDVLGTLREVMQDDYSELLDTFLNDSEARLRNLHEFRDAAQLMSCAHSFKGSASNMGAIRLAELCQDLESSAEDKSPDALARLVAEIQSEFDEVRPVYVDEKQHAHTH